MEPMTSASAQMNFKEYYCQMVENTYDGIKKIVPLCQRIVVCGAFWIVSIKLLSIIHP